MLDVISGAERTPAEMDAGTPATDCDDASEPSMSYGGTSISDFSPDWYLACNPGIGMDPLDHYERFGRAAGLLPNGYGPGLVDREWYLSRYADLALDTDPAVHYATRGWREGFDPNPDFSTAWYVACYPGIEMNPLVHYVLYGRAEGRLPNGRGADLVDERWYRARYRDVAPDIEPAVHFAQVGWLEGRNPNRRFSTSWYQTTNPGLGMNPLVHYAQYGRAEGRSPRPSAWETIRGAEWWTWKLGPIAVMLYATILHLHASLASNLWPLLFTVVALAPGAAYAAMINDLTDKADDALVGKRNAMTGRSPGKVALLLAACFVPGILTMVLIADGPLPVCLYAAAWIVFALYSVPPVRLKTRGFLGILAEASASGMLPMLFGVAMVYYWNRQPIDLKWFAMIGVWSLAFGTRGILGHQLSDLVNDVKAGVRTFAQREGEALARQIADMSFALELAALGSILLNADTLLAPAAVMVYAALNLLQWRTLGMTTVIACPTKLLVLQAGRFRLALHDFYQIYMPVGLLASLCIGHPADAPIAICLFVALSGCSILNERKVLEEALVRHYYPIQVVFDRT